MAVTTELQLPDQPAAGITTLHPLGGDGFTGPQSVYHGNITSTSDASGGLNSIYVRFDPQFVCLVHNLNLSVAGASGQVLADIKVYEQEGSEVSIRHNLAYLPITGVGATQKVSWSPPALVVSAGPGASAQDGPHIRVVAANTNGEVLNLHYHIFNFNKQARQVVPLEVLSRVLVRSESLE